MEFRKYHQLSLVYICDDLHRLQSRRCYCFHPNRLPNTGSTGIITTVRCILQTLLACTLHSQTQVTGSTNYQVMGLTRCNKFRNIQAERRTATEMASCQNSVDIDFRIEIDCTEVQPHIFSIPFLRNRYFTVIPYMVDEIFILHSRKRTLRTKRHYNLFIKRGCFRESLFHTRIRKIECIIPFSIQIHPCSPFKLRAWIFLTWNISGICLKCHDDSQQSCTKNFSYFHNHFTLVTSGPK